MTSGFDHKTNLPNLTTEPLLNPPEPENLKGKLRRRDQKQEIELCLDKHMDAEITLIRELSKVSSLLGNETEEFEAFIERMEEEERLNRWRQQSEDDEREWAIAQEEKGL